MCQTWCAAQETIRGEHSDQPLTRWCAPGISWWRAPVKMRNAPREKKTVTTKVEGRRKKKGRLTLWSSLNVPTCMRVMILCVLQAICPESKTRGETAAPWRPDARRKQLCQQRRGWLRACADYRLPPPASPIMRQSITARLDWQQTNRFAPCLHCKKKRKRSFVAKKEKKK